MHRDLTNVGQAEAVIRGTKQRRSRNSASVFTMRDSLGEPAGAPRAGVVPVLLKRPLDNSCKRKTWGRRVALSAIACCCCWLYCSFPFTVPDERKVSVALVEATSTAAELHSEPSLGSSAPQDEAVHPEEQAAAGPETAADSATVVDAAAAAGAATDATASAADDASETIAREARPGGVEAAGPLVNSASETETAASGELEALTGESVSEEAAARRLQFGYPVVDSQAPGSDNSEDELSGSEWGTVYGYGEAEETINPLSHETAEEVSTRDRYSFSARRLQHSAAGGEGDLQQQQHQQELTHEEKENTASHSAREQPLRRLHADADEKTEQNELKEQAEEEGEDVEGEAERRRKTSEALELSQNSEADIAAEQEAPHEEHEELTTVNEREDAEAAYEFLLQQLQQQMQLLQQLKSTGARPAVFEPEEGDSMEDTEGLLDWALDDLEGSNFRSGEETNVQPLTPSSRKPIKKGLFPRRQQKKWKDAEKKLQPHKQGEQDEVEHIISAHFVGSGAPVNTPDQASESTAAYGDDAWPATDYRTKQEEEEETEVETGSKIASPNATGVAARNSKNSTLQPPVNWNVFFQNRKKKPFFSSFRHKWETRALPKLKPMGDKVITLAQQLLDRFVLMPQPYPLVAVQTQPQQHQQRMQWTAPFKDSERIPVDNGRLYNAFFRGAEAAFAAAAAPETLDGREFAAANDEKADADPGTPAAAAANEEAVNPAEGGDAGTHEATDATARETKTDNATKEGGRRDARRLSEYIISLGAAEADVSTPVSSSDATENKPSPLTDELTPATDGGGVFPVTVGLTTEQKENESSYISVDVPPVLSDENHSYSAAELQKPGRRLAAPPATAKNSAEAHSVENEVICDSSGKATKGEPCFGVPNFIPPGIDEKMHLRQLELIDEFLTRAFGNGSVFPINNFGGVRYGAVEKERPKEPTPDHFSRGKPETGSEEDTAAPEAAGSPPSTGEATTEGEGLAAGAVKQVYGGLPRRPYPSSEHGHHLFKGERINKKREGARRGPIKEELPWDRADEQNGWAEDTDINELSDETKRHGEEEDVETETGEDEDALLFNRRKSRRPDVMQNIKRQGKAVRDALGQLVVPSRKGFKRLFVNEAPVSSDMEKRQPSMSKDTPQAGRSQNSSSSSDNSSSDNGSAKRNSRKSDRVEDTPPRRIARIPGSRDPRGRPLDNTCTRCEKVVLCLLLFPHLHTVESCSLMYLPEGIDSPFTVFNTKCSPCSSWGTNRPLPTVLSQSKYTHLSEPSSAFAYYAPGDAIAAADTGTDAVSAIPSAPCHATADGVAESSPIETISSGWVAAEHTEAEKDLSDTLSRAYAEGAKAAIDTATTAGAATAEQDAAADEAAAAVEQSTAAAHRTELLAETAPRVQDTAADAAAARSKEGEVESLRHRDAQLVRKLRSVDVAAAPRRLADADVVEAENRGEDPDGEENTSLDAEATQSEEEEDDVEGEEGTVGGQQDAIEFSQQHDISGEQRQDLPLTEEQQPQRSADPVEHGEEAPNQLQRDEQRQQRPPSEAELQSQQQQQPQQSAEPEQREEVLDVNTRERSATSPTPGAARDEEQHIERALLATAEQEVRPSYSVCPCIGAVSSRLQRLRGQAGAKPAGLAAARGRGETAGGVASDAGSKTSAAAPEEGAAAQEPEGKEYPTEASQQERIPQLSVAEEEASPMPFDGTFCQYCQTGAQRKQEAVEATYDCTSADCSRTYETWSRSTKQSSNNGSALHVPLVLQHIRDHPWMTRAVVGLATWLGGDVSSLSEMERRKNDVTISGLAPAFLVPPPPRRPAFLLRLHRQRQQQAQQQQQQCEEQRQEEQRQQQPRNSKGGGKGEEEKQEEEENDGVTDASAARRSGHQESLRLQNEEEEGSIIRTEPGAAGTSEQQEKKLQPGQLKPQRVRFLQAQYHPTMATFWEAMAGLLLAADEEQIAQLRRNRGVEEQEESWWKATPSGMPTASACKVDEEGEAAATAETEAQTATLAAGGVRGTPATRSGGEGGDTPSREGARVAATSASERGCTCNRRTLLLRSPSGRRYLYAVKSRNPSHVLADKRLQRSLQDRVATDHRSFASFWEAIAALLKGGKVEKVKQLRRNRLMR